MDLERVIADLRGVNEDELVKYINTLEEKLHRSPNAVEVITYYLRQIYQLTFITKRRKIGHHMTSLMHSLVSILDCAAEKTVPTSSSVTKPRNSRVKTLALCLLKDLLPISDLSVDSFYSYFVGQLKESQSPLLLEAGLSVDSCFPLEPAISKYIIETAKGKSTRSSLRNSLILVQRLLRKDLRAMTGPEVGEISARISKALIYSQGTLPKTSKSGIKPKRQDPITEIDGTPLRDFFTVLNISRHYSSEQVLNIYCFSIVKSWFLLTKKIGIISVLKSEDFQKYQPQFSHGSPIPRLIGNSQFFDNASSTDSGSQGSSSITSSMSSLHSFLYVDDTSSSGLDIPRNDVSVDSLSYIRPASAAILNSSPSEAPQIHQAAQFGISLDTALLKYCKRVISQYERLPKQQGAFDIARSSCVEALEILTLLCKENEALVHHVFPEIKRLHSRIVLTPGQFRGIFTSVLQFFITNHEIALYDINESLCLYLQETPLKYFDDAFVSFEYVDFCFRNRVHFENNPNPLQKYFPSILKILAWHPRTFIKEFVHILPVLISEENAVEMLNTLLDLPAVSLVLEFVYQKKLSETGQLQSSWNLGDFPEFPVTEQQFLFQYLIRKESQPEYPIKKLEHFYKAIKSRISLARVGITCQVIPVLLNVFFNTLSMKGVDHSRTQIFPTLCERLYKLLPIYQYQNEVQKVLSVRGKDLCLYAPSYVSNYQKQIVTVVQKARDKEKSLCILNSFYDIIGSCASLDVVCSLEEILRYYELLESNIFEVAESFAGSISIPCSGKTISVLLSAFAKLSTSTQDLVPRTILCLYKFSLNTFDKTNSLLTAEEYSVVMERCQELLSVLHMPNVSQNVLCSSKPIKPWHLDKNTSVLLKVHAVTKGRGKADD